MESHSVTPMSTDNNHYSNKKVKPSKGGWSAALFIIFVEVADRFAYYGLAGNLMMYLINVLNQPLATAAKTVNTWVGVSSLFPLLGALLADSFLGRFKTILFSSAVYLAGSIMLTVSVSDAVSLSRREALFFVAIYVLAVGEGGHKPCVQTFAADQFDEALPNQKKAKSSFFNWWYLGIVSGSTAAIFVVIYIQDNISWTIGYGILTGVLVAAIVLFLSGVGRYRKQVPIGSPFTLMAQVLVAAVRKWRVDPTRHHERVVLGPGLGAESQSSDAKQLAACTEKYRFLNKATIMDGREHAKNNPAKNPWHVCSARQVEEVKLVIRLGPVWLSCLMFNVVQAQLHTFFTKQGSTMDRSIGPHFTLPPATMQGLVGLTILATVTLYDRVFVPLARRRTGHPSGITTLQRIGFGLFLSILTMVTAALAESKRIGVAEENELLDSPKSIVPIRVWWLFPQYMICGLSDTFEVVGLQELFYAEMPESMRSLGAAAHISIVGVGSFVSSWIISLVEVISSRAGQRWLGDNLNRSSLDRFYWVLAGMSALNLCVYIWVVKSFVYRESGRSGQEKLDDDDDDKGTTKCFVDGEV